jgi:hypothetical protein
VLTRPREVNGYGLSTGETARLLREVIRTFPILSESPEVVERWGAGGTIILLTLTPEKTLPALRELAGQVIPIAPCAPGLVMG